RRSHREGRETTVGWRRAANPRGEAHRNRPTRWASRRGAAFDATRPQTSRTPFQAFDEVTEPFPGCVKGRFLGPLAALQAGAEEGAEMGRFRRLEHHHRGSEEIGSRQEPQESAGNRDGRIRRGTRWLPPP